jgi:hypothetical protein
VLPFSVLFITEGDYEATVAQQAEQLICNQRVGGSIPFGGSRERFPSGQREQTVNLPAQPSEVRILPSPPVNFAKQSLVRKVKVQAQFKNKRRLLILQILSFCTSAFLLFTVFECGSSSVVERQPSKLRVAGSNPVSRSILKVKRY